VGNRQACRQSFIPKALTELISIEWMAAIRFLDFDDQFFEALRQQLTD